MGGLAAIFFAFADPFVGAEVVFCVGFAVVAPISGGLIFHVAGLAVGRGADHAGPGIAREGGARADALVVAEVVLGVQLPVVAGHARGDGEGAAVAPCTQIFCARIFVVAGRLVRSAVAVIIHPVADLFGGLGRVAILEAVGGALSFSGAGAVVVAANASGGQPQFDGGLGAIAGHVHIGALHALPTAHVGGVDAFKALGAIALLFTGGAAEGGVGAVVHAYVFELLSCAVRVGSAGLAQVHKIRHAGEDEIGTRELNLFAGPSLRAVGETGFGA